MTTAAARLQARIDQRTLWDVEADIRELLAENERLRAELAAQGERDSADAAAGSYAGRAEAAEAQRDEARAIARDALRVIDDEYGFKELRHVLDQPAWTIPGLDAENYPAWLIDDVTPANGDAA